DRVRRDAALLSQLAPERFGECEVGGVVAVQVADLAAADSERELTAPARSRLDARPGRDLRGDLLAGCFRAHVGSRCVVLVQFLAAVEAPGDLECLVLRACRGR